MTPPYRRRFRAVMLAAALLVLVSGCAAIPTAGPVNAGTGQNAQGIGDFAFKPSGPVQDEKPADVVRGFLQAGTGQQNHYEVARDYLSPTAAASWRPEQRVLIQSATPQVSVAGESATASVRVVSRVDAEGRLTDTDPGDPPTNLSFRLTKVAGQWRIAEAPDGIVLSQSIFDHLFAPRSVRFFDPTFRYSVPDLRWFDAQLSATAAASATVRALLGGASAPIAAPVTASAFPAGTRLRSLHMTDGAVTVDLAISGAPPLIVALQRMTTQLTDSLEAVQSSIRVVLKVDGVDREVPPAPTATVASSPPLVYRAGTFGAFSDGRVTADPVFGKTVAATHPTAVTVSRSLGIAAVRTAQGVRVVTGTGVGRLIDRRSGLIAPTLDPEGWVYSVPASDPNGIIAVDRAGRHASFAASFPGALAIQSIEASRDGTRLLALYSDQSGSRAVVAGIERNAAGTPIGLTAARYPVLVSGGRGIDATWVDSGSVATLAHGSDGDAVFAQPLGGEQESRGLLSDAAQLTGGAGTADLTATLEHGDLATLRNVKVWVPEPAGGVAFLAVQR